jgi:hypothetical protein
MSLYSNRSAQHLRRHFGDNIETADASLTFDHGVTIHDQPPPRVGEVLLTPRQELALLRMRGSDWARVVADKLAETSVGEPTRSDYAACVTIGLAINKGTFSVLTPTGRFRADRLAMSRARFLNMHAVTYDLSNKYVGDQVKCTCGWSMRKTRYHGKSYALLSAAAMQHLRFEAAKGGAQ